jgi:DNA repair ATPase RecN
MALHHRFTYLALSGAAFYGDLRIEFVDGLNTPIGGCGVGKTGVLECLHFALGMEPERELRARRARAAWSLNARNA